MIRRGGLKHRPEVGGLPRGQRDSATDLDKVVAAVSASDEDPVPDGRERAAQDLGAYAIVEAGRP
jgi:hypothetical protein